MIRINYHYDLNGNQALPTFEGNFVPVVADPNTCPSDFCEPPCKTIAELDIIKSQYYSDKVLFNALETVNSQQPTLENSKKLSYYQRILDEGVNTIIMHALYDTIDFNPDTLLAWVERKNSISSELWRMRTKVGEGDYNAAYSILNGISQNFTLLPEELTDINNTGNVLSILYGKVIANLDAAAITLLKDYEDVGGDAELWVQNILALYGYYYPPRYEASNGGSKQLINPSAPSKTKENKTYLNFQPNPANHYVTFSIEDLGTAQKGLLLVKNMQGQTVYKQLVASYNNINWEVKNNPAGVYYYQLTANGENLQSGKIIINR